jgi:hypothetical protein
MDLSADGINWKSVENILQKAKKRNGKKTAGTPESLLLKGSLRIEAGFFTYRQFTWEPFHADVNFDGNTVSVHARRAALCGISTTGDVTIAPSGAEIDIALSAENLQLQSSVFRKRRRISQAIFDKSRS